MELKPIRTESDYRRALAEIETLMDAEDDTAEADRLEVLATLVEAYEDERWPIEPPDPISAIKHMLELRGLSRGALVPILGTRARVSEILNRKRLLTLPMIWRLVRELGIPASVLVKPYPLSKVIRAKKAKLPPRKRRAAAADKRAVRLSRPRSK